MGIFKEALALLLFLHLSHSIHQNDESLIPVLMWNFKNNGDLNLVTNSLHNYDTLSFTSRLQKIIKSSSNPLVVCFVEPILSVEDFSLKSKSFSNLQNDISNSKFIDYLSSVYNPVEGIENLKSNGLRIKQISSNDNVNLYINDVDVLIISLVEDDDLDRSKMLSQHDKYITETYKQLFEKRKNVIGLITGDMSSVTIGSLIRYRRSANDLNETQTTNSVDILKKNTFIASGKNGRAMLHTKRPAVLTLPDGIKHTLIKDEKTEIKLDDRNDFQRLIISFFTADGNKIVLRLRFDKESADKWSMRLIELESPKLDIPATNLTTNTVINSQMGRSFMASKEVEFSNDENIRLTFPAGFQVQPWMLEVQGERFAEASEDLNHFFTPAIWMGIFVMSILAMIFTMGITMIMDIKTMDRFDDSKGKTITINVSD